MRATARRPRRTRAGATKLNWVLTAGDEGARTVVSVFRTSAAKPTHRAAAGVARAARPLLVSGRRNDH